MTLAKVAIPSTVLDQYPWGHEIAALTDPTADLLGTMWALGYVEAGSGEVTDDWALAFPAAAGYARDRAASLVAGVDDVSRDRLRALIADAIDDSEMSEADLSDAILSMFDDMSTARAELIARTETAYAAGHGNVAGYRDGGTTYVEITDGDDFDEPCRVADGQIWSLDYYEANLLEHPDCSRSANPISSEDALAAGVDEE
ncbi:MAG TPA: hypothetical protein VK600_00395 [Candidatus Saccharimonadales bacterium]|nr:hypothetical protein [Candidatus Saccharimonadales bacterium]